jgi:tRNA dimethylallyltransferase
LDKNTLKENIRDRVLARIEAGALDEVKDLLKKYPDKKLGIYTSLGVSQIIDFLEEKISKEKLIENWTVAEVSYAGRQMVWFKKQPDIVWYDKSTDRALLVNQLKKIYQ